VNRHSIGARLAMWNALFVVGTFALTGAGTWWAIRDSIYDTVDAELHAQLESLTAQLAKGPAFPLAGGLKELARSTPSDTIFRIGDRAHWIYQSPAGFSWDSSRIPRQPRSESAQTIATGEHTLRVLTAPVSAGGSTWTVEIAAQIDELQEILSGLVNTMALASPIAVLVAAGVGYHMSRRALEPVSRITRTAQSIGADNLAERLPLRGVDDELERLSRTVNGMLGRLEDAFRRVTQFTADASHELRTPVAIIRTAAEVSRRRPRSGTEYVATLGRILDESERASRLIDDLLTLARADAGADRNAFEQIDLADILRDACQQQRTIAQAAGLRFEAAIPPACPMTGDEQQLRRLVLILLDNAVKYTAAGGSIAVALSVARDGHAVTEVRDTGPGIDPHHLPHIFERFYRMASGRSRETGGYGLGLSIARCIAAAHGGTLTAESHAAIGSVFRITLPLDASVPSDVLQNRQAG
jgi:heavy metal sensor kinase